ncbi:hypothetical protein OIU79_022286 [Salix purpurea]|uniref:Uncharacterized protein n=1 Tax=Salix purpurea TaxID=77065 RepID=A0A9Q0WFZ0_SALPP|nr:hypothetical protein OIU79_022286 [Salix purpurea]
MYGVLSSRVLVPETVKKLSGLERKMRFILESLAGGCQF